MLNAYPLHMNAGPDTVCIHPLYLEPDAPETACSVSIVSETELDTEQIQCICMQPWERMLLQPEALRPEVAEGRKDLCRDMVRRWKEEIPEQLKRFYFIATICDPRQKRLCFPGVTDDERTTAHAWFR